MPRVCRGNAEGVPSRVPRLYQGPQTSRPRPLGQATAAAEAPLQMLPWPPRQPQQLLRPHGADPWYAWSVSVGEVSAFGQRADAACALPSQYASPCRGRLPARADALVPSWPSSQTRLVTRLQLPTSPLGRSLFCAEVPRHAAALRAEVRRGRSCGPPLPVGGTAWPPCIYYERLPHLGPVRAASARHRTFECACSRSYTLFVPVEFHFVPES